MSALVLALLTALKLTSYDLEDEYYLLLDTGGASISFSSFRLSEPERIVLEVTGSAAGVAVPAPGATVGRIDRDDLGERTRLVFHIAPGSAYTILHRKNLLLIGFRRDLFITDETIETTIAAIETRLADRRAALAAAEAERIAAEEAKRLAAAEAETKRVAAAEEAKKVAIAPQPEKKAAPKPVAQGEDDLVAMLSVEETQEKDRQAQERRRLEAESRVKEEAARVAALEQKRKEEEAAEKARVAKAAEERRLADAKRAEEQRCADEQMRLAKTAEEKRRAEAEQRRIAEEKRVAEEKRMAEEKRVAEEKRLAALKQAEEEKRRAEERRLAEEKRLAEERRLAAEVEAKRLAEEERLAEMKAAEAKRLAAAEEAKKVAIAPQPEKKIAAVTPEKTVAPVPVSEEEKMKSLKVVKLEPTRQITEDAPPLKVVTLVAKGKLKNLFFRKFPEFSRVTMEVSGDLDYAFREIKGGYVIDIHNFEKIPNYLLHIIDARAFNAEVQYLYPKRDGKIFKIYIKSDQNIAVRKSEEEGLIHFDFFVPTMQ